MPAFGVNPERSSPPWSHGSTWIRGLRNLLPTGWGVPVGSPLGSQEIHPKLGPGEGGVGGSEVEEEPGGSHPALGCGEAAGEGNVARAGQEQPLMSPQGPTAAPR